MSLVQVDHLMVHYGRRNPVHAVRDVSLTIGNEEFIGLVGESGCGKSTLGFAIARLERPPAYIVSGQVMVNGIEWTGKTNDALRSFRWKDVAVVLQSGMNALNPVLTVRTQFWDVMSVHTDWSARDIERRSEEVLWRPTGFPTRRPRAESNSAQKTPPLWKQKKRPQIDARRTHAAMAQQPTGTIILIWQVLDVS